MAEDPKGEPEDVKEEKEDVKEQDVKEEKVAEMETDAADDKRPKVKEGSVALNMDDATLNVMAVNGGKMLMPLTEGGMQYLLACARCTAGVRSGRYVFEVRILENLNPFEAQGGARSQIPRQFLRIGLSLEGSSLFLDSAENLCFDSEGFFVAGKTRRRLGPRIFRDQTVALLVNLDDASPNAQTVSLFIDGQRATEPVPLPEEMKGKVLFPTINYKNLSLELNFGPTLRRPLPFTCHMLGAAAEDDVIISAKREGKGQFVLPVGLPEMGYFDWVDKFLAENPGFVELSDRMMLDWAAKSGIWRRAGIAGSNDKPEANTGVTAIDDWSISRVVAAVAPTVSRNYVVPELKANLVKAERKDALERFSSEDFTRKAVILMGDPKQSYLEWIQKKMLEEKQWKAEAEKARKVQEAERKKQQEERKRKLDWKGYESKRKKANEDEDDAGEAEVEEIPDEKEEEPEVELPIELTEEEKALKYRASQCPDIGERELARSYASFALPEKSEGFDSVEFDWDAEATCASLLKSWVLEKKQTQRAEDLSPGADFKEKLSEWQKLVQDLRKLQTDFKDPVKRKAAKEKKLEEAKQRIEEEKKALVERGDEEGAKALEAKAEAEQEPAEVDMENLDVFAVEDINDVGNGEPLFGEFQYEDWTLLNTRFELHLLIHSFKKDLDDPDRPSFPMKHLAYYYHKYYRKAWTFQQFGVNEFEDLLELLKDSISMDGTGHLKADDPIETPCERFVKLTEDNRRERQRRIDAGDETARLRFTREQKPPAKGKGKNYGQAHGYTQGQKRPFTPPAQGYKQARTTYSPGYGGGAFASNRSVYGR